MGRMSKTPQEEIKELVAQLHLEADDIFQDIAELMTGIPTEQLFGDNEFVLRDKILKLVGSALTARLAQKKMATSGPVSIVPTVNEPPASTITEPDTH